ncbi:hypothetical protein R3W88_001684 [Solanum pinnatisectum]|uniref:Uncharacterized protein n=1 Tax=Solanum pinnatisectum TaxID=50273 RepID=A0AAV9MKW3_9SOLN|nr:hypothetical protein R3W88_001684 [Solanum pinnatisectum]
MHRCSDETTPTKQNIPGIHQCLDETALTTRNIPGMIPKEVELEPLGEDEWDGIKTNQCTDDTKPTKKNILGVTPEEENILGVIPEEVKLECLAKDEKDVNQIHQCLDETTPTKKNILQVIPEKVELEPLVENEDEKLSSDNGYFSDRGPQKKRAEKKTCTTTMLVSESKCIFSFQPFSSKALHH